MTERDLIRALDEHLPIDYRQRRVPCARMRAHEVDGPFRRPDLIQLDLFGPVGDTDAFMRRCAVFSSRLMSRLYCHIRQCGRVRAKTIYTTMWDYTEGTVRSYLRQLIELGWIEKHARDLYATPAIDPLPDFRLWTFEAKLHDWRQALNQIASHKVYADRTLLVMSTPATEPTAERVYDGAVAAGASLLFADPSKWDFEIAHWPAVERRPLEYRIWALGCVAGRAESIRD